MRGRNFFIINEKSSHKNIKYASHLLPCKLSRKFISWASTKTKTPSFFFCSANHSGHSYESTSPTDEICFQLGRT